MSRHSGTRGLSRGTHQEAIATRWKPMNKWMAKRFAFCASGTFRSEAASARFQSANSSLARLPPCLWAALWIVIHECSQLKRSLLEVILALNCDLSTFRLLASHKEWNATGLLSWTTVPDRLNREIRLRHSAHLYLTRWGIHRWWTLGRLHKGIYLRHQPQLAPQTGFFHKVT